MKTKSLEQLEQRLERLIDGLLSAKGREIAFLSGLNRLDDIILAMRAGEASAVELAGFFRTHRDWLRPEALSDRQRARVTALVSELIQELQRFDDADSIKLGQEAIEWYQVLGNKKSRLTLKSSKEELSLADRYCNLLRREAEEISIQLSEHDHLLTCLDDMLDSAEKQGNRMYHHMAASLIYYLKMEGYKVDPYVNRLRRIRLETKI